MDVTTETPECCELELPADFRFLAVVRACIVELLRLHGGGHDAQGAHEVIALAVHEVCANQIEHAYDCSAHGRLRVTMSVTGSPGRLVVESRDTGRAFLPSVGGRPAQASDVDDGVGARTYALGDLPVPEPSAEGGYGLYIVTAIMDEVSYHTAPVGNHWRMVKRLDGATASE